MPRGSLTHAANDSVGIGALGAAQLFDRLRHRTDGMLPQQFQHAHVLLRQQRVVGFCHEPFLVKRKGPCEEEQEVAEVRNESK